MPTCQACGRDNARGVELCRNCGARLKDVDAQPPVAQPEPSLEQAPGEASGLEGRVLALMREGRKIQAIKLYRGKTRTGLKEAKDAVEQLAAKHGITPKGAGCASVLILALAACGMLLFRLV